MFLLLREKIGVDSEYNTKNKNGECGQT